MKYMLFIHFLRNMFRAWLNRESKVLRGDSICTHTNISRISQRVHPIHQMKELAFVTCFYFLWLCKMLFLCHSLFSMGNILNTLCSFIWLFCKMDFFHCMITVILFWKITKIIKCILWTNTKGWSWTLRDIFFYQFSPINYVGFGHFHEIFLQWGWWIWVSKK